MQRLTTDRYRMAMITTFVTIRLETRHGRTPTQDEIAAELKRLNNRRLRDLDRRLKRQYGI